MEIDFFKLLSDNVTLMVFSVVGLGLLLGRLKIGSIEVGSTTGVLLIGLLFGHIGFEAPAMLGSFGFAIFIFAVGLQAGPTFFSVFAADGARYIVLALVVAATAFSVALLVAGTIDLDYGMSAGLLAGALTSTPTLAGAQDALTSGLATVPEGMEVEQAARNVSIAYAITYIFGTIGLIVFVRYLPELLRINLPEEARKLATERGFGKRGTLLQSADRIPLIRAYRVPESVVGKSIGEIREGRGDKGLPLRLRRAGQIMEVKNDTVLEADDVVSMIGSLSAHEQEAQTLGPEQFDPELLNYDIMTKEVAVTSQDAAGRALGALGITQEFGCFVRGLRRASIELPVNEHVVINRGDRLAITGEASRLDELAAKIGYVEAEETQTDLLSFSIGISVGVLLGMIMLKFGGVSIGIGSAGGLLLVGIILGFLRSLFPTFGGVPPAARNVMMEFGLVVFMAGVGLRAGAGIVEGFLSAGPQLIIGGVLVTLLPVAVGYLFGWKVLRMNPSILLGSITGAMTSTPSLKVVTDAARSDVPALGYAGTYTFANVLLTFAGTIMMSL